LSRRSKRKLRANVYCENRCSRSRGTPGSCPRDARNVSHAWPPNPPIPRLVPLFEVFLFRKRERERRAGVHACRIEERDTRQTDFIGRVTFSWRSLRIRATTSFGDRKFRMRSALEMTNQPSRCELEPRFQAAIQLVMLRQHLLASIIKEYRCLLLGRFALSRAALKPEA